MSEKIERVFENDGVTIDYVNPDDFLVKPLTPTECAKLVKDWLPTCFGEVDVLIGEEKVLLSFESLSQKKKIIIYANVNQLSLKNDQLIIDAMHHPIEQQTKE